MKTSYIIQGTTAGRFKYRGLAQQLSSMTGQVSDDVAGAHADYDLQRIINNTRLWYGGELILSTWEDQNDNFYGIDKIVKVPDPGPGPPNGLTPVAQHCNLIRQIVGLKEALKVATGDIVFKVRADCVVSKNVFELFDEKSQGIGPMSMFKKKITVGNIMTINPDDKSERSPFFRVSDWWQLGQKEDLVKLCDILDIIEETDFSFGYLGTEQIWLTSLLKKFKIPDMDLDDADWSNLKEYKDIAWDVILQNFKVVNSMTSAGVFNIGRWQEQPENLPCYLTEEQYNTKLKEKLGRSL